MPGNISLPFLSSPLPPPLAVSCSRQACLTTPAFLLSLACCALFVSHVLDYTDLLPLVWAAATSSPYVPSQSPSYTSLPSLTHTLQSIPHLRHRLRCRSSSLARPGASPTPSTTTRIARVCQDSDMAPITGSLPRFLWPHDVVVWVRSSTQGSVQRRVTDEGRSTPKTIRASGRSHNQHLATRRCTTMTTATNRPTSTTSPPKLTMRDNELKSKLTMTGCASRPNKNNEVRGQTDR